MTSPHRFLNQQLWILPVLVLANILASGAVSAQEFPGQERIDNAAKKEIIDSLSTVIDSIYVFPDVGVEMVAFMRKQLADGEYDAIETASEFTNKLTEDLRSVCHDLHLNVYSVSPDRFDEPDSVEAEQMYQEYLDQLRRDNYGFRKIETLTGNVGYLRFDEFAEASVAGHKAIAAMKFLSDCDALIFDLRYNGGGSPSMIQLISSYLFEGPVHLNSFYIRELDSIQQFWTQSYVEGERMPDVPVFVLTSEYTFSGAEEFTFNLKNLERATIIGETTGGGAHPVDHHLFAGVNVGIKLPFGRAINPITGTNWEGTGVEPHISVPDGEAFGVAHLEALKALRDTETDDAGKFQYEWAIAGLESELNPVHLEASELKRYEGTYGPRRVWLEGGSLKYQRGDQAAITLFPIGNHMFGLEGVGYFRMQFVMEVGGEATKLVGLYDDGRQDGHDRSSN
jgi:hypothetical protein